MQTNQTNQTNQTIQTIHTGKSHLFVGQKHSRVYRASFVANQINKTIDDMEVKSNTMEGIGHLIRMIEITNDCVCIKLEMTELN